MSSDGAELPDIVQATANFEKWAARHVNLIRSDVELKHGNMAQSPFPFLRATFYRWAQWWPLVCPELARATQVLAIGDLHIENFGTWRDLEGRLIWGVNDFDEAWPAAYTVDLVRLVTSAYLAIQRSWPPSSRSTWLSPAKTPSGRSRKAIVTLSPKVAVRTFSPSTTGGSA
jgi:hypothetical protein